MWEDNEEWHDWFLLTNEELEEFEWEDEDQEG